MIQSIKIKNFLSFKDEVKFSFEASKDTFAEESQVVQIYKDTRLLRFAIVYGYNASGKTNLLRVMNYLHDFWFNTTSNIDERTGAVPFKLDMSSPNEPSEFELVFWVENTKYWYQLSMDGSAVLSEKLYYYKSSQPALLFERNLTEGQSVINYNIKVSNVVKESIAVHCLRNMSFFAARNQVNTSIPQIDAAMNWMKTQILPTIFPQTDLTAFAQREAAQHKEIIPYIVNFLREADFNIDNISTDMKEQSVIPYKTDFEHGVENERGMESYLLKSDEESRGTLRTFGIESVLYNALQQQAFLAIDEIETSLHPKLLEKILFEYLRVNSRSQILVTTHNDGLLDLVDDLIRKDSVWFTEKQKSGVTDLYKLTDFRGLNRLSSIREAYRNKRFGATMR